MKMKLPYRVAISDDRPVREKEGVSPVASKADPDGRADLLKAVNPSVGPLPKIPQDGAETHPSPFAPIAAEKLSPLCQDG